MKKKPTKAKKKMSSLHLFSILQILFRSLQHRFSNSDVEANEFLKGNA